MSQPVPAPTDADRQPDAYTSSRRRLRWLLAILAVLVALVVAAVTVPVNAVIESPGPTWNVLGKNDEGTKPLIEITGATSYEASGALRMTTVAVRGCPGYPVHAADVLLAWLSHDDAVVDREAVCPSSMSEEEVDQIGQEEMASAQSAAVVAALMETGKATRTVLEVLGSAPEQKSATTKKGDVLTSVTTPQGTTTPITSFDQLRDYLTSIKPGTTLTLGVTRSGTETSATLTTVTPSDEDGDGKADRSGSMLGLYLGVTADSDISACFGLEDVGGPSAGMIFALGIVDALTPGNLTGGKDIAGTGTIDAAGSVGAIGGIAQKMAGARSDGAQFFLAPAENCSEVVGHVPEGLTVVAVKNLHEAVAATQAIGAGKTPSTDSQALHTCESVLAK